MSRMEVEVVLGQVGEQRHLEVDRVGPVQRQRVRGHLHHAGPVARLQHPPKGRLQIDRLRRRPLDLLLDPADDLPHRPQQPALHPRRLQHLPNQEGSGRLPIRPGNPNDPQLRRRIPPKPSRQRRHSRPRIRDHNLSHSQIQLPLDHQRHRPSLNSRRSKLMPIDLLPRHAEEQRPGPNFPAVISERPQPPRRRPQRPGPQQLPRQARPISRPQV